MLREILERLPVDTEWHGKLIRGAWSVVYPGRYLVRVHGNSCYAMFDDEAKRWFARRRVWVPPEALPDVIMLGDAEFWHAYKFGLAGVVRRRMGVKEAVAKGERR